MNVGDNELYSSPDTGEMEEERNGNQEEMKKQHQQCL